jgi:hypothetical protein
LLPQQASIERYILEALSRQLDVEHGGRRLSARLGQADDFEVLQSLMIWGGGHMAADRRRHDGAVAGETSTATPGSTGAPKTSAWRKLRLRHTTTNTQSGRTRSKNNN